MMTESPTRISECPIRPSGCATRISSVASNAFLENSSALAASLMHR
jgi:hypothetical protein